MREAFLPPVRFSRLLLKVNAFLLVALLLVGGFLGLVAYKQGWFVPQTTIRFVTADALGINPGMPVKLYGFTVGSVKDMQLGFDGVEVRLSIASEYLPRIPRGSRAKFARESGVIGASVIEIVPPKGGGAFVPLAAGDRIEFERSRGISEIVEDFRRQATPALNELKQTFAQINRSGADIAATLAALRRESERLPATQDALRKLIADADRTASNLDSRTGAALDALRRAGDGVGRETPRLATQLSTTLDSIAAAAAELRRTAVQAQETLQRTRPVVERGGAAVREASEVFDAAKRVWPLKDAFPPPADATLPIDSFESGRPLPAVTRSGPTR